MFRKIVGWLTGALSLFSALCFLMAMGDLLGGTGVETPGTLLGLMVFFGGVTAATAFGAFRLITSGGARARTATTTSATTTATALARGGVQVDIELEARILALAAKSAGRVTVTEVAIACAVPLTDAERALDTLAQRGHADLEVTPDGESVYAVRGFLSAEEKREAVDVVEHVRS